ncbi:angiotensinogen [Eublepharis macularius]|uniref:Angiotensinogen n=1 Tax=Eublepharis macularius TaxID=481883 RepID=A0AA97LE27_EUBMA|nr:angiotensinogen [Eublepharis macularius]
MNPGVNLLCILVCIISVTCDRVYVHPFHLFTNHESCKKLEDKEWLMKTFVPTSIESHITPAYEESVRNKSEEEPQILGVDYLKDSAYVLGARIYRKLAEMFPGENILLSPTSIYQSLLIFYLGASGHTANELQSLLGFNLPSVSQDCTSKIDGHKILPVLRTISNPNKVDEVHFSKLFCLFSAPNVHLSESFVHELAFANINFYVRAVDFTNLTWAGEQIDFFVKNKNIQKSKNLLTDMDPASNLLFATYTQLKVVVKGASLLSEPQEFWTDSETQVFVPMMTVTGSFEHKFDNDLNLSVIKIAVGESIFLLLLQPINNEDLSSAEAQYSFQPSYLWLQKLSLRRINLTLPNVSFENVYNLQDPLNKMGLSELLGKSANFSMMSNANLNVRKIINHQLLELRPGEADRAENPTEPNEDTETLKVTLNKPFLLAVHEKESCTLLYFGRVINPFR